MLALWVGEGIGQTGREGREVDVEGRTGLWRTGRGEREDRVLERGALTMGRRSRRGEMGEGSGRWESVGACGDDRSSIASLPLFSFALVA